MNQRGDQPRVQLEAAREERLGARPFADALCKQAVVATEEELREQELQRAGHESCSPVFHGTVFDTPAQDKTSKRS